MSSALALARRAFAARFKDLRTWNPRSVFSLSWNWPDDVVLPLSKAIQRKSVPIEKAAVPFPPLITLHFDGMMERRAEGKPSGLKGRLFLANAGDVIYSKIDVRNGAIGVVPDDLPSVALTSEYPVYSVDSSVGNPAYIRLLFRTSAFRGAINALVSGASGRKRVNPSDIEALSVPLPSLLEQLRIVTAWEALRVNTEAVEAEIIRREAGVALALYQALGTSSPQGAAKAPKTIALHWREMQRWSVGFLACSLSGAAGFTQSRYPIEPLALHLKGTMNGYCIKPVSGPTPYKMLKLSALKPSGLDLSETKFVQVSESVARRFALSKRDLLICRSVGSYNLVAKSALVEECHPEVLFPDIIIRCRMKTSLLPEFVREVVQSPLGRAYFQSNARTAVGMWKIGADDIRTFPIPVPPLPIQENIVADLEALRAAIKCLHDQAKAEREKAKQAIEAMILGTEPVQGDL